MKLFKALFILLLASPVMAGETPEALTYDEYARKVVEFDGQAHTLNAEQFLAAMKEKDVVVLDLRPEETYKREFIRGAYNLGPDITAQKLKALVPSKETKILVYCDYSLRPVRMIGLTNVAMPQIAALGYKNVYALGPVWQGANDFNAGLGKLPMIYLSQHSTEIAHWYACQSDDECVAMKGVCPGIWQAINKNSKADYEAMIASKTNRLMDCGDADPDALPGTPICAQNQCVLFH